MGGKIRRTVIELAVPTDIKGAYISPDMYRQGASRGIYIIRGLVFRSSYYPLLTPPIYYSCYKWRSPEKTEWQKQALFRAHRLIYPISVVDPCLQVSRCLCLPRPV